jgi:uncharacterized repeat protein (TIGR01451 family)
MSKMQKYRLILIFNTLLIFVLCNYTGYSQVTVNINSGNPKIPFPQFLDYTNPSVTLKNLGSQNSPGVPHAEMEQRMRDAWQIFANEFVYTGTTYGGKQYIKSNIGCPYDCSEGEGYALLAAAIMADKTTFDGLWMRIHDIRMMKYPRYVDCVIPNAGYVYGPNTVKDNTDAASDGSFDIAMGLYIGWKQWGDLMGINDACGNPISYKQELLNVTRGLVEIYDRGLGDCRRVSGSIGFDGYIKNGNTGPGELTGWATGMCPQGPEFAGPSGTRIDYAAPSYFKCFGDFLQSNGNAGDVPWNINQFRRAEASSDWLMGQMNSQGLIPVAGTVTLTGATPVFSSFIDGEDFRASWRTILNYLWNGNPTTSWNPTTHQVVAGANTYERDLGISFAAFLKNPQSKGQGCDTYAAPSITFKGPPTLSYYYSPAGAPGSTFTLNWLQGCGSTAAVAAQDFDLMGEMFRQCVIEWDGSTGYLTSTPLYFHGFFRLLGMLTLSGNLQAPCAMAPQANMKVYKATDKTFAYEGDLITYTLSYRNYGSLNATGVKITDVIPAGLQFVSATNGGTLTGSTVTWNLGTVNGFVSGGLAATQGTVSVTVKVAQGASGRICNIANITCTNGLGWTSNEYPNNITDVMERNCVDIVQRPLYINKNADVRLANPGQVVNYTLDFGNQPVAFLNGGRPGINVAFANNGTAASSNTLSLKFRLYHGADEAYINYKNYRISYFLQDGNSAWVLGNTIYEGGSAAGVTVTQQNLNPGTSGLGAWNQRMIIQFANQLATTTPHLLRYSGLTSRIHEGGTMMLRAVWDMHDGAFANHNWLDDWSADNAASATDGAPYFPVTNDWTDPNNPNIPVTKLHKNACATVAKTVNKILVEEWDGYTWRRVLGTGPVSGREVQNVVVTDVLPVGLTWGGFTNASTLGVTATYNAGTRTITWTIPLMLINDIGQLKYWATVNSAASFGGCPINTDLINTASISGTNESAAFAKDTVTVTCNPVPPAAPAPSSLSKTITTGAGPYSIGATIGYTLTYTNTTGSVAIPSLNNATDWTLQSGSGAFTFGSAKLTTVNNQNTVMTYGYSHGTDGTLTGTITPVSSAIIGIAMRHTGGAMANGVYVTFKPNSGAGNVEIKFWNGTTLVSQGTYALASGAFTYKIVLSGGTISVWLNSFAGAPLVAQSGMTVQAGYAGVINGDPLGADSWGSHQITNFNTNLDSGFNIQMYDPLPSNLTYVSSSNSGTYSAGTITWPMTNTTPATPLLAGATIVRTFTTTVNACAGGFVSNTGFIKVLGFTPDPGSQINTSCNLVTAPVNWLYFNAKNTTTGNLLTWATSTETNNNNFIVERSDDAVHFTRIYSLQGSGNSNLVKQYSYTDHNYASGTSYYRITQVDYDGKSSVSNIVSVTTFNEFVVQYYPNPFNSNGTLLVRSNAPSAKLTITSVIGVELQVLTIETNKEVVLGDNLPSGTYILFIESESGKERIRIVKNE